MKIVAGISVCGWVPERVARADKLAASLDIPCIQSVSPEKEHASIWWYRLATSLVAGYSDADAYIFLNDDVEAVPELGKAVAAAMVASGQTMLSLHTSYPESVDVANTGGNWVRGYWLTGPGYAMSRSTLHSALALVESLNPVLRATTNEDNVIQTWRYRQRWPIWSTVPALVKHDDKIESVIEGHDEHDLRTTCVPWLGQPVTEESYWRTERLPPILENPFNPWPHLHAVANVYDHTPHQLMGANWQCPPTMGPHVAEVFGGAYDVPGFGAGRGDTILDIGANIGAFTRFAMTRYVGAEVVAFEPSRSNARVFRKNCPTTRLATVAVTTKPGPWVFLYDGARNCGEHSLQRGPNQHPTGERVQPLHPSSLPKAAMLKVDTEGCELEILREYPHLSETRAVALEWHRLEDVPQLVDVCARAGLRLVESNREARVMKFARPT